MIETIIQKDKPLYPEIIWLRAVHNYSSGAGKLLLVCGSGTESKEALQVAESAFQCGTGNLTLAFPESLEKTYKNFLPKEMLLPLPETPSQSLSLKSWENIKDFSESNNVDIIGPGLSKNSETTQLIWQLIHQLKGTQVISGDGIRALIIGTKLICDKEGVDGVLNYFKNKLGKTFLIMTGEDLNKLRFLDPEKSVNKISQILNCSVVLIADDIYFTHEEKVIRNISLKNISNLNITPILSGVVGSLLAQNIQKPFEAVTTAIYILLETIKNDDQNIIRNLKSTIKKLEKKI